MDRLTRLYLEEVVSRHGVPVAIKHLTVDSQFTSHFLLAVTPKDFGSRTTTATTLAFRLRHSKHFMVISVDYMSAGPRSEIVSTLAHRSSTNLLRENPRSIESKFQGPNHQLEWNSR
ncbi:hypothetical protein Tco_0209320 [Tanacetum coccineum]